MITIDAACITGSLLSKIMRAYVRELGQEEKGTTEDEMAGWHHGLDGHESE